MSDLVKNKHRFLMTGLLIINTVGLLTNFCRDFLLCLDLITGEGGGGTYNILIPEYARICGQRGKNVKLLFPWPVRVVGTL